MSERSKKKVLTRFGDEKSAILAKKNPKFQLLVDGLDVISQNQGNYSLNKNDGFQFKK